MGSTWTKERRERLRDFHRVRLGAPPGFCTIYGLHVPAEHHDPVRHFAEIAARDGRDEAVRFILKLQQRDWSDVPRLRQLHIIRQTIEENRRMLGTIRWEAYRADQNSR